MNARCDRQRSQREALTAAALILALAVPIGAIAEPMSPDAEYGLAFARDVCSECHEVEAAIPAQGLRKAPPFAEIAADPAFDAAALLAFFQSPHPLMPNFTFVLDGQRDEDLVAYFQHLHEVSTDAGQPRED